MTLKLNFKKRITLMREIWAKWNTPNHHFLLLSADEIAFEFIENIRFV